MLQVITGFLLCFFKVEEEGRSARRDVAAGEKTGEILNMRGFDLLLLALKMKQSGQSITQGMKLAS